MKKVLLLSGIAFVFASCSNKVNNEEILLKEVEAKVKEKMNDAESYEFVSFEKIDSITYGHNVNSLKSYHEDMIGMNHRMYETFKDMSTSTEAENTKRLNEVNKQKTIVRKIDSLEIVLKDSLNNIASYTYLFKARGNNALGAKVLGEYIVQTNSEGTEVINITDNRDKVLLSPNEFPGYKELIK